jgi:regulator of cell morphogenesis and NO signaling
MPHLRCIGDAGQHGARGTFDADVVIMLDTTQPLAQIVLDYPETAAVFQRLTLDFCCHVHQRLGEACANAGFNEIAILRELEAAIDARAKAAADPRSLATPQLIRLVITEHHGYLRAALPKVRSLAVKVAAVHGLRDARLYEISTAVRELSEALLPHLDEEETLLFPAMQAAPPDRAAMTGMLASMKTEHETVGALLAEVRRAASDYLEPEWACRTYRALFAELVRLEADTLRHVHLENHVLAPRFEGVS